MKHILQIQLEHKENVIREIEIPSNKSLKDLHEAIINSLALKKYEMASFYITNEKLELLEEIPLFKIDEKEVSMTDMKKLKIENVFPHINTQLIYVYDFLKMWRFLVSYLKQNKNQSNTIKIKRSIGEMPKKAPEIIFESENEFNSFQNNLNDSNILNEGEY